VPLISHQHGKARVRVARIQRDGERNSISELSVQTMLHGEFAHSFTDGDNTGVVATDTIKNLTNIVARENLGAGPEAFARALAARLLDQYPQIDQVSVTCHETRWTRARVDGAEHPHAFLLDANGTPSAELVATREGARLSSGITGYTFMKTTQSGWVGFDRDAYTTLPETTDRIAATAMDASWLWAADPADFTAANARIIDTMLAVFATTYSRGIQDSLFRMAEAALAAVPEVETITMACPNKHYIPVNLAPFGLSADNMVFTPTDEPCGRIECTVGR